jgi:hypothetical protein
MPQRQAETKPKESQEQPTHTIESLEKRLYLIQP